MLEERECKICGVWFQPKRKNNIYCEECSKRSGAKKKKMKRQIMISISRCGTGNWNSFWADTYWLDPNIKGEH